MRTRAYLPPKLHERENCLIMDKNLIPTYELIVNKIVLEFAEKHDIVFDGWIGDNVGEVATFSDYYFFNFGDICFDMKTNQPPSLILYWNTDTIENSPLFINFKSYSMGLRYDKLKASL